MGLSEFPNYMGELLENIYLKGRGGVNATHICNIREGHQQPFLEIFLLSPGKGKGNERYLIELSMNLRGVQMLKILKGNRNCFLINLFLFSLHYQNINSHWSFHKTLGILPVEDIDGDHKQLNNELHCILACPGSLDLHHFLVSIPGTYTE